MNHSDIEDMVSAYVNSELPDGQREFVEEHLSGCSDCQNVLADFTLVRQRLMSIREVPAIVDIRESTMSRIAAIPTADVARREPMGTEIGILAVRRSILINTTPERVWKEFESFERMTLWFGTGHTLVTYEPWLGGWVEVEVDKSWTRSNFGGRVTVFEPARELTFEDDWIPSQMPDPSLLTIRLTPALGGTLVELFDHGFERVGTQGGRVHQGHEGGWTVRQLEALKRIIDAS